MRLTADRRERLDRFLARSLPQFSRSRLAVLIQEGGVRVEGQEPKAGLMLKPGYVVTLEPPEDRPAHDLTPAEIELDVLFEDGDLLVVNKPRGLATHPAPTLKEPTLVNALLARGSPLSPGAAPYRPGIVHRLDKDTTGLLVVAKTEAAHGALAKQFASRRAKRTYLALLMGDLERDRVTVDAPLARDRGNRFLMTPDPEGKPAVTHLEVLERTIRGTLVRARLETGRTHQIRAHCKFLKHPVWGDRLYAPPEARGVPLQLHAERLAFEHPRSGEALEFCAPPPGDFLVRLSDAP
jgi:23S rRNA pseudouridine1911/1915/1917 synthase